jgi:DNA-damage-inducible protein J
MMTKVAKEKVFPFEPLSPSAETVAAMRSARKGKLKSFRSVDDLMADLNESD